MDSSRAEFDAAISRGVAAAETLKSIPAFMRCQWLKAIGGEIEARRDLLITALTQDIGKTVRESCAEVDRTLDTFAISAEESLRIGGDKLPMDRTVRGVGYWGMTQRFPIGLCGFIAPYNFPLNLAAHKIGPAIAVGNPFVLKMPTAAPRTTQLLNEILALSGMPDGSYSVMIGGRDAADILVTDPRINLLSFTGSPEIGWSMKSRAGKKSVILELGGNAAVIVEAVTDIEDVAKKVALGAFYQAGQSCISVQRIFVKASLMDSFMQAFDIATARIKVGDPMDADTDMGPLVNESAAVRVMDWVAQAQNAGGEMICGGTRSGSYVTPTILKNVPLDQKVVTEEVFGPVAVVIAYDTFESALSMVNDSKFGLQVGIFTQDYTQIMKAFETLDVGGVVIGNVPSFRLDHMPYGGIKDSGLGREGIRSAIQHMTEERLLILAR